MAVGLRAAPPAISLVPLGMVERAAIVAVTTLATGGLRLLPVGPPPLLNLGRPQMLSFAGSMLRWLLVYVVLAAARRLRLSHRDGEAAGEGALTEAEGGPDTGNRRFGDSKFNRDASESQASSTSSRLTFIPTLASGTGAVSHELV